MRFEQVRKEKFIRYGLCVLLYNILTPSARVKMCMKLRNVKLKLNLDCSKGSTINHLGGGHGANFLEQMFFRHSD